jgi:isopentenyl-diphosphate delta-isomerase
MDLILVDEDDNAVGAMEKMAVHEKALLHRAFSIFIFNTKGEMLLHKRAEAKYHSAGLWSNACCSHPAPGQDTLSAALKRLYEEMGFSTVIKPAFKFIYKASLENGLTEHEFDHVFVGTYDGVVKINREEASDFTYQSMNSIRSALQLTPELYTAWFKIAFPKMEAYLATVS